ncbi:hypothetical protein STSP2_02421 [Anaerohalosphaera lusitana]|uniref:Rubrerythrin diiron-binding domain-containing protein n=1 Tax=Anaerohalosphaera lusitana TaxID=1936003 RepID=A0A1U9NMQ6_9BACT|nr:ferritin family protein [Anaerohalosphaera lusitana]AQT69232.1 hypothetical protein STSP2_02421 [Anaerohalosphaera lusitana]
MPKTSTEIKALQDAVTREVEAYLFYKNLAARTRDEDSKDIFEMLAQEEVRHKENLELELMKRGCTVQDQGEPDWPGRIAGEEMGKFDLDYIDALRIAIQKEDSSVRTYIEMAASTKDSKALDIYLGLAEEEMRHKLQFQAAYNRAMEE